VLTAPLADATPTSIVRRPARTWALGAVALALVGFVAVTSRSGAVADRIRDPGETGVPRPVEPMLGFDHWIAVHQVGTLLAMTAVTVLVVVMWRRRPRHPILLMVLATTSLMWLDPVTNWAPYGTYNPQLRHFPETWPWVSIAPTVQPFIVIGYAVFYVTPYFVSRRILQRLQERRPPGSFVRRHPLVSIASITLPIGFVLDASLEISLIRTQLYVYSQAPSFGTYAAGRWYQFPLLYVPPLVNLVMVPVAVLLHRDEHGRSQAERLAERIGWCRGRPATAAFLVMFVVVNACYASYAGAFALIRAGSWATSVACPYPFEEAKVYDPNALYAANGQPGPYFRGLWAVWRAGQPDGRPDVDPPPEGGRCAP
jgi:hypothetical protein